MKTTTKMERLYYGMRVYSISNDAGQTVELPAGVEPNSEAVENLLSTDWGNEADRALVETKLLELVIEAKIAEITAYDESEAVNSFELNGMRMWLPFELREKIRARLPEEEAVGRQSTTLWYGTTAVQLPVSLAKQLISAIELYATDCYDRTAAHKAAVSALTSVEAVRAYDHTTGYPDRLVISTAG